MVRLSYTYVWLGTTSQAGAAIVRGSTGATVRPVVRGRATELLHGDTDFLRSLNRPWPTAPRANWAGPFQSQGAG